MDLHHQGTPLDAEGNVVQGSTLWPNATATAAALGIGAQFEDVIFRSKQVVAPLLTAVGRYRYANFSRYPGTTPPGISRNAYGLPRRATAPTSPRPSHQRKQVLEQI